MHEEAVSNSGPLIHLSQINKFDLLGIFPKIYISAGVYSEASALDPSLKEKIDRATNIKKVYVATESFNQLARILKRYHLDTGELQSISLCQKLDKKLFLTDDLDAREAAGELGLEPHGSVGLIVLAYRKGYVKFEDAEKAMNDLYEISNLFITKSIVDIGISELRKHKR